MADRFSLIPQAVPAAGRDPAWLGDLTATLLDAAERRVRKDRTFAEAVASLEALLGDGLTFQEIRLALALALRRHIGL